MKKIKSMTTSRKKLTANSIYDFLYMIVGQVSSRKPVNLNEGYPPNCQMGSASQIAIARHGLTAEEVNGTIYGIGAGPDPGLSYSHANEIFHAK